MVTVTDIGRDADLFRRAYPNWPHSEERTTMATKNPSAQAISRLLKAAGYDRSEVISQSRQHGRHTAGFCVRGGGVRAGEAIVVVGWRPKTPLVTPSAEQAERDKARALEMASEYAEVIRAAGWPAGVIHLAGPVVRVTAKEA